MKFHSTPEVIPSTIGQVDFAAATVYVGQLKVAWVRNEIDSRKKSLNRSKRSAGQSIKYTSVKKLYFLGAAIILAVLLYGFLTARYDAYKLSQCSVETKAILEDIIHTRKQVYTLVYSYQIGNQKYTMHQTKPLDMKVEEFAIGDSIGVKYQCSNFENVTILRKRENASKRR